LLLLLLLPWLGDVDDDDDAVVVVVVVVVTAAVACCSARRTTSQPVGTRRQQFNSVRRPGTSSRVRSRIVGRQRGFRCGFCRRRPDSHRWPRDRARFDRVSKRYVSIRLGFFFFRVRPAKKVQRRSTRFRDETRERRVRKIIRRLCARLKVSEIVDFSADRRAPPPENVTKTRNPLLIKRIYPNHFCLYRMTFGNIPCEFHKPFR